MNTESISNENVGKLSMIELANLIMLEEKKEMSFKTAFEKIAELKGMKEEDKQARIAQFYTDLNADGRFVSQGANVWGLKKWYSKNKSGELVADESQEIIQKQTTSEVEKKAEYSSDSEDEKAVDDIDATIDDFKDDDYYDEEDDLDEEIDEDFDEEFDEDDY